MSIDIKIVKEAQVGQNTVVANHLVSFLKAVDELEGIGGRVDYVVGLRHVIEAYPNGIVLSRVQTVLPDSKLLADARKALVGVIDESPKGKAITLKPKTAPAVVETAAE